MKNNKKIIVCCIVFVVVLLCFFIFKKDESDSVMTTDSIDSNVNTDDGDEDIVWSDYENREIVLTDSITITEEGIYNLSGSVSNGLIKVNSNGNVKLNLNNVTIINSNGPAIYIESASDVVINIIGDNYLEDGSSYSGYTDVDGVLFSHDDLTLEGDGTLTIKSNYLDGIVSKDDLKIINGTYIISSNDDGIRGKDSVYIIDGDFDINSEGDGIKSTNDTDSEKGFIKISNGKFEIVSSLDGIKSENKLIIENGEFNITTGGGSSNSSSSNNDWGYWGRGSSQTNTDSAKGIKSVDNIVISSGTFIFDTSDDSIHSNNYVGISGGVFTVSSGDDGIHADYELIIDDGDIDINKSYEGLESAKITVNGGNIEVVASDDGINVAGGNDGSATGRPGENHYTNSNNILTINNGNIYVNASGDGIDVNGSAYINGGDIRVDGPTDSGNGALDYDRTFSVNGGTFIAGGSSGMALGTSNDSEQNSVMIYFTSTYSSSDTIKIIDSNNNEIMSYNSNKSYSSLLYSGSDLVSNETYTVLVNDVEYYTFEVTSRCNTVGNSMGGMMPGGGNRPGRR